MRNDASERPPAAWTRLSRGFDAFYGTVDGSAVDASPSCGRRLCKVVNEHLFCRKRGAAVRIDARYLYGAGELGGGHGLGEFRRHRKGFGSCQHSLKFCAVLDAKSQMFGGVLGANICAARAFKSDIPIALADGLANPGGSGWRQFHAFGCDHFVSPVVCTA